MLLLIAITAFLLWFVPTMVNAALGLVVVALVVIFVAGIFGLLR